MSSKTASLCVLLDANIIIHAHASGVWALLMEHVTPVVPSTVMREATHYIDPAMGMRMEIHLEPSLMAGSLREVAASPEHIAAFLARFDPVFVQRMDAGEAEALAMLAAGELPEHRFCTSDGPAIRALCLLDLPEVGLSLETLLRDVGLSRTLPSQYRETFFREMLSRGAQERIAGVGLRAKPSSPKVPRAGRKKHPGK